ncbi:hypothetical protein AURDEDRAFT_55420 [Auricularia subglabra TFB-10046 SS5]|nr:hypothetical protein AURDEDRAFT_55420 [Auricularia subglabra TFB-10046 SS5]
MAAAVSAQPTPLELPSGQLYTCLSCAIAFHTAEEQRGHYRSDHHRYNMKRRVAGLPPVSADAFNEKVLERRAQTAITLSAKDMTCDVCRKVYTTENAYLSHLNSKKHKENELKPPSARTNAAPTEAASSEAVPASPTLEIPEDADEEAIEATIDARIAAARNLLASTACLFCPASSANIAANLEHMNVQHGFFVPDAEFLVDVSGLHAYLAGKVAVAHACIYCAREFRTLDAVRKHMADKSHAKVPYNSEKDRLEISDFYDFSSSYPDAEEHKRKREERKAARKAAKAAAQKEQADADEWEDDEEVDGEDADEVVDAPPSSESDSESKDEELPPSQITYGDSQYELVLPNGARLGHRSLARYYKQRFTPIAPSPGSNDPNSGAAMVRKLLADKNSALVPARGGGFGAFGSGTEVVKARNRGEAREAGRHVREHRDQRRREEFRTRIAFINNSQKHFRDPLLQVSAVLCISVTNVLLTCACSDCTCRLLLLVSCTLV